MFPTSVMCIHGQNAYVPTWWCIVHVWWLSFDTGVFPLYPLTCHTSCVKLLWNLFSCYKYSLSLRLTPRLSFHQVLQSISMSKAWLHPPTETWEDDWQLSMTCEHHIMNSYLQRCDRNLITEHNVYPFLLTGARSLYGWNAFFDDASLSNTGLTHRKPWWKSNQSHRRDTNCVPSAELSPCIGTRSILRSPLSFWPLVRKIFDWLLFWWWWSMVHQW